MWGALAQYGLPAAQIGSQLISSEMSRRDKKKWEKEQKEALRKANLINVMSGGRTNVRPELTEFKPGKGASIFGGLAQGAGAAQTAMQLNDMRNARAASLENTQLNNTRLEEQAAERARDLQRQQGTDFASSSVGGLLDNVDYERFGEDSPRAALQLEALNKSKLRSVPEYAKGTEDFQAGFNDSLRTARDDATSADILERQRRASASGSAARITRQRSQTDRQARLDARADETAALNAQITKSELESAGQTRTLELGQYTQELDSIANTATLLANGEISIDSLPPKIKESAIAYIAQNDPKAMSTALRRDMTGPELVSFKSDSAILTALINMQEKVERGVALDKASDFSERDVFSQDMWSVPNLFNINPEGEVAQLRTELKADVESVKALLLKAQGNVGAISDKDIERAVAQLPDLQTIRDPIAQQHKIDNLVADIQKRYMETYTQNRSAGMSIPTSGNAVLDNQMEKRFQDLDNHLTKIATSAQPVPVRDLTGRADPGNVPVFDDNFHSRRVSPLPIEPTARQEEDPIEAAKRISNREGSGLSEPIQSGSRFGAASTEVSPEVENIYKAIVGQESGGDYNAVNPNSGALGIAQVMPSNISQWSQEVLGQSITPEQFLQNPDIQDKIVKGMMKKMLQKALQFTGGDFQAAARRVSAEWYAGPSGLNRMDSTVSQAYGHPSVRSYTGQVADRLNSQRGGQNRFGIISGLGR